MELLVSEETKQIIKPDSPLNNLKIKIGSLDTKPVLKAKEPPRNTSRGGDRVFVEEGSPSEEACFKACVVIDNPKEFDCNHDGFC